MTCISNYESLMNFKITSCRINPIVIRNNRPAFKQGQKVFVADRMVIFEAMNELRDIVNNKNISDIDKVYYLLSATEKCLEVEFLEDVLSPVKYNYLRELLSIEKNINRSVNVLSNAFENTNFLSQTREEVIDEIIQNFEN